MRAYHLKASAVGQKTSRETAGKRAAPTASQVGLLRPSRRDAESVVQLFASAVLPIFMPAVRLVLRIPTRRPSPKLVTQIHLGLDFDVVQLRIPTRLLE